MLTYFNGFLSNNYNQVIKNHLLDLENSLTYIKSARAQIASSYVKLHFYGLRWVWKVKKSYFRSFYSLPLVTKCILSSPFWFIFWKYNNSLNDSQESFDMNQALYEHTLATECYIVANFFEFIEEKYNFVKNFARAWARARMPCHD